MGNLIKSKRTARTASILYIRDKKLYELSCYDHMDTANYGIMQNDIIEIRSRKNTTTRLYFEDRYRMYYDNFKNHDMFWNIKNVKHHETSRKLVGVCVCEI